MYAEYATIMSCSPPKHARETLFQGGIKELKNYVVQPGDTLFAIARREYGDSTLYRVIARQNHVVNPDIIGVGEQLLRLSRVS